MLIELPNGDFVDAAAFKAVTARETDGAWRMEVTFADGTASRFPAPSQDAAKEAVKTLARQVNAMRAGAAMPPELLRQMVADRAKAGRK